MFFRIYFILFFYCLIYTPSQMSVLGACPIFFSCYPIHLSIHSSFSFSTSIFYLFPHVFFIVYLVFFPIPCSPPFFKSLLRVSLHYFSQYLFYFIFVIFVQPLQIFFFLLKPRDFRRTMSAFGIYCGACLEKVGSVAAVNNG